MLESPLLRKMIVVFVVLGSTTLYTIAFIPENVRDLTQFATVGLIIFILAFNLFFKSNEKVKQHFKVEIYMFLLATFFSMFIASAYHNQDFSITLIVQRFMYFYFFYFLLHTLKIDVKTVENLLVPFGVVYAVFYIAQYFAYPTLLFDSRVDADRGTIRIFIPGASFIALAYYKSLQDLLKTHRMKYGLYCFLFFIVIAILTGTRQSLASTLLFTTVFIFFSKQVKSRIFIILMAAVAGLAIFIIFYDIFMEMVELTEHEATKKNTNIRLIAMRFFTSEFMPADIAYIFGNGQDSLNSSFGVYVNFLKRAFGLYQSDVGLIGDYSKFGVLFVIAQLSIILRLIFGKLPSNLEYIKYFMLAVSLTMFSGSNGFGRADGIVFYTMILYIIDVYKHKEKNAINNEIPEKANK